MPVVPKVIGHVSSVVHAKMSTNVHTLELEARVTFTLEDSVVTRLYPLVDLATQHSFSVVRALLRQCDNVEPELKAYLSACEEVRTAHGAQSTTDVVVSTLKRKLLHDTMSTLKIVRLWAHKHGEEHERAGEELCDAQEALDFVISPAQSTDPVEFGTALLQYETALGRVRLHQDDVRRLKSVVDHDEKCVDRLNRFQIALVQALRDDVDDDDTSAHTVTPCCICGDDAEVTFKCSTGQHAVCADHLSCMVRAMKPLALSADPQQLPCACDDACGGFFDLSACFSALDASAMNTLVRRFVLLGERRAASERGAGLADAIRTVVEHLTFVRCPNPACDAVFNEPTAQCSATSCPLCECHICGLCFARFADTETAHRHARMCLLNPVPGALFMTANDKKKAMEFRFVCGAIECMASYPADMRTTVFGSSLVREAFENLQLDTLYDNMSFNEGLHVSCPIISTIWTALNLSCAGKFCAYSSQTAGLDRVDHLFTHALNREPSESVDTDGHSFHLKLERWDVFWGNTQAALNGAMEALPPGVDRTVTVISSADVEMWDVTVNAVCAVGLDLVAPVEHAHLHLCQFAVQDAYFRFHNMFEALERNTEARDALLTYMRDCEEASLSLAIALVDAARQLLKQYEDEHVFDLSTRGFDDLGVLHAYALIFESLDGSSATEVNRLWHTTLTRIDDSDSDDDDETTMGSPTIQ